MQLYESTYKSLQFERAGLFAAIRENYRVREVLYPGCSVHITPSLYFPHVVYVDRSESAAQFFADEKPIRHFVNRNRQYKQSSYIRFIHGDYSEPLPLREDSFDLLLALFAGGVAKRCAHYLKIGGALLTNNHQADAMDALTMRGLKITAKIQLNKQDYILQECSELEIPKSNSNTKNLKQTSQGLAYVDGETYYLFQRWS